MSNHRAQTRPTHPPTLPTQSPAPAAIQLEEGKRYRDRTGMVWGPIHKNISERYPFREAQGGATFTKGGRYNERVESDLDLVAEVPPLPTAGTPTPTPSIRREVLDTALDAVTGDRALNYGAPEQNFQRIAHIWNGFAKAKGWEVEFTPTDVAQLLIGVKQGRLVNTPNHRDSWVDIAGYAACGAEASEGEKK